MDSKEPSQDLIEDVISEEAFHTFKKNNAEVEKGTMSIYIFSTLTLLFFVMYIMMHSESIDWVAVFISMILIIVYYCLAAFSSHKPFTAFILFICFVGLILFADVFLSGRLSIWASIVKIVIIVYVSLRLEAAKNVQAYKKANFKKS